jgi:hypothetical protein
MNGDLDVDRITDAAECPPDVLTDALGTISADQERGLQRLDVLLEDYPLDPRLHFLRGSVLAGLQRYGEGHVSMKRAVEIAPGFAVARFQLGFLEFTSGDAGAAEETWGPLEALGGEDPLVLFSRGLQHLARDEFRSAIDLLRQGMGRNTENPLISSDMQLIIDRIETLLAEQTAQDEPVSSTHLLLKQFAKSTKH